MERFFSETSIFTRVDGSFGGSKYVDGLYELENHA